MTVCVDCLGALDHNLFHKLCCGVHKAGNGHGIGFTKWNRYWMSGQSVDSPLFCFGTVKNSPGFVKLDQNRPCVVCMNCVEIVLAQVS